MTPFGKGVAAGICAIAACEFVVWAAMAQARPNSILSMQAASIQTPAVASEVSVSTTSAAATSLTSGGSYRVACDTDNVRFRVCVTGTCTAVATDNILNKTWVETLLLKENEVQIAFVLGTGTAKCTVARRQ